MLGIHKSHSPRASTDYYPHLASEGKYYIQDSLDARWYGRIAARLGIEGKLVNKEDFNALVSGRNPRTGEKMRVRNVENAVSSIDFTWSCSKSVSVAFAITKDPQILECHSHAVEHTMSMIQEQVQTQHNTPNKRQSESSKEFIASNFLHLFSRPVEVTENGKKSYKQDPQIHTHSVLPAITFSKKKQRYQAIELHAVHSQAKYWENAYHSILAYELNKLGYKTRQTKDRFEIQGITNEVIKKFSGRSAVINKTAQEQSITDPVQKAQLGKLTRHSKAKGLNEDQLHDEWKNRLTPTELKSIQNLKQQTGKTIKVSAKEAVNQAIKHHEERLSAFKENDVKAFALKLSYGSLLPEHIDQEMNKREDIIRAEKDHVPYMTTARLIKEENTLIQRVVAKKRTKAPINKNYIIKDKSLTKQQQNVVHQVAGSQDMVVAIHGYAGTGKSRTLKNIDQAHIEAGKKTFAIAPSSHATSVLKKNGFSNATTLAAFLKDTQNHEQIRGNTVILDEAGMVGLPALNELISVIESNDSRLAMCGDTRQHVPPAQRGDAMHILMEKAQVKTVYINKIMRQKNEDYRQAVELLAKNQTLKGFNKLQSMKAVQAIPEKDQRLDQISKDFVDTIKAKKTAIVVAPTIAEGDDINNRIRFLMASNKMLKGKERLIPSYRNLTYTEVEKAQLQNYEPGQIIRFINNAPGHYKAGSAYEVVRNEKGELSLKQQGSQQTQRLPIELSGAYQVYAKRELPVRAGDHIKLTQNTKTIEGSKALNGTQYEITGFTKSGDLKLHTGKTLKRDVGHWRYQYCDTSHGAQGRDADFAFVSVSEQSLSMASQEQLYVSVSRGKHGVKLYTDDVQRLKKAIQKSEQRMTAQDILDQNKKSELVRHQRNHHRSINEKIRDHGQIQQRGQKAPGIVQSRTPNIGRRG